MAVPKGKVSRQRRDKRRSSVWKLTAPQLVACPNCGELVMPHRTWKRASKILEEEGFAFPPFVFGEQHGECDPQH